MLEKLNKQQQEAVKYTDGSLLVLAGAGSGKTKVLTTRIVYLVLHENIQPSNILAITFTNKAAKEMKERVIDMLGITSYKIQISTFHSFGLLLIKENCKQLGYDNNFTILDSEDTLTVIKKIIKNLGLDIKEYSPRAIKNRISSAKNEMMDPDEYSKYANTEFENVVVEVYRKYQEKLKNNNSLDFDDLLILPIKLFQQNPTILQKYQEKYRYILVDEYQDTNQAQYLLIKMLSALYKNICVVGDNDQSIYGFRGANYKNILNFEKDYPNTKVILLEENYRSTQNILDLANDVIRHNKERKKKNLWTNNGNGAKIKYYRAQNEKDEAIHVVDAIKELINKKVEKSNIAVLYRTNAQSRIIEDVMRRENIPYKVVGSFYFYNRKEIKDLISYLKLIYNPHDDVSLTRIINVPKRKIGLRTIENINNKASLMNTSMFDAIDSGKELEFKNIIKNLQQNSDKYSLTDFVDLVLDTTGIRESLQNEKTLEADIRLENLEEFKSVTKNFDEQEGLIDLGEFLEQISLVADIEEHRNNTDVVTLMTVHSAKGLEFDHIFITGLEEGIFPHNNSFGSNAEIEEERRLCYVAITRAKKTLHILNAKRRMIYGLDSCNPPSRFVNEMDNNHLELENDELEQNITKTNKIDLHIDKNAEYVLGEKIIHDKFGHGIIVQIEKDILTIAFKNGIGIRKMLKGHKSIRKEK